MIPGLRELLSHLTYDIGFNHPGGLAVLFVLGVFSDIGIPLLFAVEIFLLFATYYVGLFSIQVPLIIFMLLLGNISGGSILYWLSSILGDPFLDWLDKHFPWIYRRVEEFKTRINEHTILAVTLVRLTPGFLQVPSLVTGSLHLKYLRFLTGLILASLIYNGVIVAFGYIGHILLGTSRANLENYLIIGLIILIAATWVFFYFRYRHSFNNKSDRKGQGGLG